MNMAALYIPILFLHFTVAFLEQDKIKKPIIISVYIFGTIIFIAAILFPQEFLNGVRRKIGHLPHLYYTDAPGILYGIYTALFFICVFYPIYLMFKARRTLTGFKGKQIKFFLISFTTGFVAGGSTFLLVYNIPFPPYTLPFTSLWTIFLAYTIIKYRALEIDTVIHQTILWVLLSMLVFIPIGLFLYFTRPWLNRLSFLPLTLIVTIVFFIYLYYYNKIQPRINHFFKRRKYNYQYILSNMASKFFTLMDVQTLSERFLYEISGILYLKNAVLFIIDKDENQYNLSSQKGYTVEADNVQDASFSFGETGRPVLTEKNMIKKDPIVRWLLQNKKVLEKVQIEINPVYKKSRDKMLRSFYKMNIELFIPILYQDNVYAILGLGQKQSLQSYKMKDIDILKKLGEDIGVIFYNAMHYESLVEIERIEREMDTGREIQLSLLPREIPDIKGLAVHGFLNPAKEIGGDYYDFIPIDIRHQYGIAIGDISGKGISAGLLMSMVKSAMLIFSQKERSPKQVLLKVNHLLHQYSEEDKFMTLLYLIWDDRNSQLNFSSAGHEHILVYKRTKKSVRAIPSGGTMAGIFPDISKMLKEKAIKLDKGDKVLLYTDGCTDARNKKNEQYGLDNLMKCFQNNSDKQIKELISSIKKDIYLFMDSSAQFDDMTLVAMEAV